MTLVQSSRHLQLDTMSHELHNYLEIELKATILSLLGVNMDVGMKMAAPVLPEMFKFFFSENILGMNYKEQLDLFNPLGYNRSQEGQKTLLQQKTKWKEIFILSTRGKAKTSWENIAKCALSSQQYPRPSIFNNGSDNTVSCSARHATQETKEAIRLAGRYHQQQLDNFFRFDREVT